MAAITNAAAHERCEDRRPKPSDPSWGFTLRRPMVPYDMAPANEGAGAHLCALSIDVAIQR